MKAREALSAAARALENISETPRLDAELLLAHAMDVERDALILSHLDAPAPPGFGDLLDRRLAHEPVAYIIGWKDFWDIRLSVGPGVLIPRPDSETLIEAAIDHFKGRSPARILDLGTGPGTLLLAALSQWPDAYGLGIDHSERALDIAELNAANLGLDARTSFKLGNWADGLDGQFDLILCNPPYVENDAALPSDVRDWEPHSALFAGPDGLDDYRVIAPQLPALLASGGVACIEIGHTQAASASALFTSQGFHVSVRQDLAKRDRCLVLAR